MVGKSGGAVLPYATLRSWHGEAAARKKLLVYRVVSLLLHMSQREVLPGDMGTDPRMLASLLIRL